MCSQYFEKILLNRAYFICANVAFGKKKNYHLKKVFDENNDYSKCVINQVLNEVKEKHKASETNVSKESQVSPATNLKHHF